jgi:RNA-directed DNA polymerase
MTKGKKRGTRSEKTLITVLELSAKDARKYFLEPSNYCNIELPNYFQFGKLLKQVAKVLNGGSFQSHKKSDPRDYESVNHLLYNNKDGKYAWRPLQIIHPVLYVSLVNEITNPDAWDIIKTKFQEFQ